MARQNDHTAAGTLTGMYSDIEILKRRTARILPERLFPGGYDSATSYRGTTAERDVLYGDPATLTDAQKAELANRRINWYNTDLSWEESYFAVTGLAGLTAPGLAAGVASGWYPTGRGPLINLLTEAAQAVVTGNVYTNWGTPGTGLSWRRGGVEWFGRANDRVIVQKAGRYRIHVSMSFPNGSGSGAAYVQRNGATAGADVLTQGTVTLVSALGSLMVLHVDNVGLMPTDTLRWYAASMGGATVASGANGSNRSSGEFGVEYLGPWLANF